jgi:hypothetical protein
MKLRLNRDSVRFRLSRSEVEEFGTTGRFEERLKFGIDPSAEFGYVIETSHDKELTAYFSSGRLGVRIPVESARHWVESDQIGIEGRSDENGQGLKILIEKDFACRTSRGDEDTSDYFPNPLSGETC